MYIFSQVPMYGLISLRVTQTQTPVPNFHAARVYNLLEESFSLYPHPKKRSIHEYEKPQRCACPEV